MHGLSTATPQKMTLRTPHAEPKAPAKAKKTPPKTRRVFEEVELPPSILRAVQKGKDEIARGESFTLEELEAKYL